MAQRARSDIDSAAMCLMAFIQGRNDEQAEAGALLIADALVTIRNVEPVVGYIWKNGRPGI